MTGTEDPTMWEQVLGWVKSWLEIRAGVGPRDFEGLANAAGILVGASFAIDRTIWFIKQAVAGSESWLRRSAGWFGTETELQTASPGRTARFGQRLGRLASRAARWGRREKDASYYSLALVGGVLVSAYGGIRALSLIDLAGASPPLDVAVTTVIVAFGGERLAALMGIPGEVEEAAAEPPAPPEPPPIRIEGSITVVGADGREITLRTGP